MSKLSSIVGAALGLAVFLGVGLLPSLLYGGYAGVLLAGGIFGTPIESTLPVRALIVGGMIMGTTAVASLFMVTGAVLGAVVGRIAAVGLAASKPSANAQANEG